MPDALHTWFAYMESSDHILVLVLIKPVAMVTVSHLGYTALQDCAVKDWSQPRWVWCVSRCSLIFGKREPLRSYVS